MPDTKVMDITDLAVANASRKAVMSVVKKDLTELGKLIQYRCPDCNRLLFKFRAGNTKGFAYIGNGVEFTKNDHIRCVYTRCTKCHTALVWTMQGLMPRPNVEDPEEVKANFKVVV